MLGMLHFNFVTKLAKHCSLKFCTVFLWYVNTIALHITSTSYRKVECRKLRYHVNDDEINDVV